jgi:hypothetical protein
VSGGSKSACASYHDDGDRYIPGASLLTPEISQNPQTGAGWGSFTPAYKRQPMRLYRSPKSPRIPQPGRLGIFHSSLQTTADAPLSISEVSQNPPTGQVGDLSLQPTSASRRPSIDPRSLPESPNQVGDCGRRRILRTVHSIWFARVIWLIRERKSGDLTTQLLQPPREPRGNL